MTRIDPPQERECTCCGRQEVWDEARGTWAAENGGDGLGRPHCVHEWDISGAYSPVTD